MKLKIAPDSITFKLSEKEKQQLVEPHQSLTEKLNLPHGMEFSYTLYLIEGEANNLVYDNNEIMLYVSADAFSTLIQPSKKGLVIEFPNIKVSVEVDVFSFKRKAQSHGD